MKTSWLPTKRMTLLAALGLAALLGNPAFAQTDQGKWWTPKQGGRAPVAHRPNSESVRPGPAFGRPYTQRRENAYNRGYWGGPMRRDFVMVRRVHRGRFFRARRVYFEPYYYRHIVYVRPVRFYFSADAHIGPVDIHVDPYGRDDYLYGCNFCDARFDSYGGYATHLRRCDARPDGYDVRARDWEDGEFDEDWRD